MTRETVEYRYSGLEADKAVARLKIGVILHLRLFFLLAELILVFLRQTNSVQTTM
jgi:hypothetical protein